MTTLGSLFDGIGGWQLAVVKNGMAQPCADFVIEKLAEVLRREVESYET